MRRSINVLCLSASALMLLPTGVVAQQKSLKEQIQGPWSQASCNSTTAKGEKTAYCANNPRGILILAGNGNYAWTAVSSGRKDADAPGLTANFGTWSVNEADKTLTLKYEGTLIPNAEGSEVKVSVNLTGDELKTVSTSALGKTEGVYRRAK